ncbi:MULTISPECIES: hypothetical protein [unclassified Streptomyces]|uniref:hypothetical protein n=1 Tax=unclassified Streptomyces TaxID=2593676 RepID=UPI003BAC0AE1
MAAPDDETGDGGKDLKTDGLGLIAKGLTEALSELKELGMVGTAGAGRGFGDLALSGLELGHEGLTGEFKSFCERWEWGVRSLINEGNGPPRRIRELMSPHHDTHLPSPSADPPTQQEPSETT